MLETRLRPSRTATGGTLSLLLRNPSAVAGIAIILFWTLGG